ncbi:hypothetical protein T492DRAFT_1147741, partial [Pavlovales sp. CCMP2436]
MGERVEQAAVPTHKAHTFSRAPRTSPSGTFAFQQMTMRDKRRGGNAYLAPGERRVGGVARASRPPPADALEPTARRLDGIHRPIASAPPSTARVLLQMQRDQLAVTNELAGGLKSLQAELAATRAENEQLRALATQLPLSLFGQPQPQMQLQQPQGQHTLSLFDLQCHHLRNRDKVAAVSHAPFVVLRAGNAAARTRRCTGTLNPTWLGRCLSLPLGGGVHSARLEVWDWTATGSLALGRVEGWHFDPPSERASATAASNAAMVQAACAGAVTLREGAGTFKLVGSLQEVMPGVSRISFRWKVETLPHAPGNAQPRQPQQPQQPQPQQAASAPPPVPLSAGAFHLNPQAAALARASAPEDVHFARARALELMAAGTARTQLPLAATDMTPSAVLRLGASGADTLVDDDEGAPPPPDAPVPSPSQPQQALAPGQAQHPALAPAHAPLFSQPEGALAAPIPPIPPMAAGTAGVTFVHHIHHWAEDDSPHASLATAAAMPPGRPREPAGRVPVERVIRIDSVQARALLPEPPAASSLARPPSRGRQRGEFYVTLQTADGLRSAQGENVFYLIQCSTQGEPRPLDAGGERRLPVWDTPLELRLADADTDFEVAVWERAGAGEPAHCVGRTRVPVGVASGGGDFELRPPPFESRSAATAAAGRARAAEPPFVSVQWTLLSALPARPTRATA